jgi:hypothetical protein
VDPPSLIPLGVVIAQLLARPRAAREIAARTVATYSLSGAAIETIVAWDGP